MDETRWRGLTHEEIYSVAWSGSGPSGSAPASVMWTNAEARLRNIDQSVSSALKIIKASWEGTAAEKAGESLGKVGAWAIQAARNAARTADALDTQAQHVADMRNTLPPPPPPDPLSDYPYLVSGPDAGVAAGLLEDQQQLDAKRAELAQQAVQAMKTYTTNSAQNKAHIYAFASPLPVTNDAVAASSFSPTGLGPGAVGGFGGGLPNPVTAPAAPLPPLPGSADVLPIGQTGGSGFSGGAGIGGGVGGGGIGAGAGGGGVAVPFVPGAGLVGGAGGGTTPPGGRGASGVRPGLNPSAGNRQAPSFRVPPPSGTVGGGRGSFPGLPGSGAGAGLLEPGGLPRGTSGALPSGTGSGTGPGTANGARATGTHGFFPPGGGAAGGQSREHRRPPYLIDDTDAFGDDRYFTPQVITPDDYIPRRT